MCVGISSDVTKVISEMKLDNSVYPHFCSAASVTNRPLAVDALMTTEPSNESGNFVSPQRTLAALLGYFILIGRSCQPGLLTARLAGRGEPRNLKPLAEMPMREHQGHAQGSTGE